MTDLDNLIDRIRLSREHKSNITIYFNESHIILNSLLNKRDNLTEPRALTFGELQGIHMDIRKSIWIKELKTNLIRVAILDFSTRHKDYVAVCTYPCKKPYMGKDYGIIWLAYLSEPIELEE